MRCFYLFKTKTQAEKNIQTGFRFTGSKKSQIIIEQQSIGTTYIPPNKFKANFLEYYAEYVERNRTDGNRALQNSISHVKGFISRDSVSPIEITKYLYINDFVPPHYSGQVHRNVKDRLINAL